MSLKNNNQKGAVEEVKRRKINLDKIDNMLEMPEEIYSNKPKLIVTGFEEMIIENYKGILEYEDYYVRINTHIGLININGFNLKLEKMTGDDIKIIGKIESIDIERTIEQQYDKARNEKCLLKY